MIIPKHKQDTRIDQKIQVIGPSLLEAANLTVWHEYDCVKVDFGAGHVLTVDYPTAIKLSQLLRVHGKQAKKFAGDQSKGWNTEASILTDAEQNYKRGWDKPIT